MKKIIVLFLSVSIFSGCTIFTQSKPDKRDKYVGEYKLYSSTEYWETHEGTKWNEVSKSYEMEYNSKFLTDSTKTLIVTKSKADTISLKFDIVSPFDFETQREAIEYNEKMQKEIQKKNEQSICGPDEDFAPMIESQPTYSDSQDLEASYDAYVKGHKIFLKDIEDKGSSDGYYVQSWSTNISFDSVYLMNDTIHFIRKYCSLYYCNNKCTKHVIEHTHFYGVKQK